MALSGHFVRGWEGGVDAQWRTATGSDLERHSSHLNRCVLRKKLLGVGAHFV
jgi:hypothetical protein